MGRAQRWASVVLAGLLAPCLLAANPRSALAAQPVLGWTLDGFVEAGGMYSFGELGSSKFNQYRDMDNGFVGEIDMYGEKKDSPYFFELRAKNPARSDQLYEGAFGRYGWFQVDLSWNRTPVVVSNSAGTIYQTSDDALLLPASPVRDTIATTFTTGPTTLAGRANIQATINRLLQPVDLSFNTDVGTIGLKVTPLEAVRFDFEYQNIRQEGRRPLGAQMAGSTLGPVQELAIPIENYTNQFKFGAEYARQHWGLQFNYIGSFFDNSYQGYTWDNPTAAANTGTTNARDRLSAAPDNSLNTFSLTGTAALPFRTRINGTFAYTMLRQNQVFEFSTGNTNLAGRRNTDDAGKNSADAQSNLLLGNIVLTSRPINPLSVTARYRYYEYQNDKPQHVFTNTVYPTGGTDVASAASKNERYTKQNAGIDFGYRPIRTLSLKAGYEYEHWNRADYGLVSGQSFSNSENIGKFAADVTPVDWFLGRVTYTYGDRSINGYPLDLTTELPQSIKYNYSPRIRNRVDTFFQFMFWEKLTPSITVGYAVDDYRDNQFGLTKDDYFNAGFNLDWNPLPRLTLSGDFTYELYNYEMANRFVSGALPGTSANTWTSKSKDEFYNVGLNAVVDIVPKKFIVTLGYTVTFGYTTYENATPYQSAATSSPQATAFPWPKVQNVLQTARIVGRFRLTEHISLRGGFAYERYNEKNWARDPMQPFMGNYDSPTYPTMTSTAQGAQSVWLGTTQPNYESYTFAGFVRYDF